MKNTKATHTISEIAQRWSYHPASIPRLMKRFGVSGMKFGDSRQSGRRYYESDVLEVERLVGTSATPVRVQKIPAACGE